MILKLSLPLSLSSPTVCRHTPILSRSLSKCVFYSVDNDKSEKINYAPMRLTQSEKHAPFDTDSLSQQEQHVIKDDWSINESGDNTVTEAERDWADIVGWSLGSWVHWEKKQWQKTACREQNWDLWEMRQEAKWVLEGRYVKRWRNVIYCSFFLHHCMHIFHPAEFMFISIGPSRFYPSCLIPPRDQTSLYLIKAPGWDCTSYTITVDRILQVERQLNCPLLPNYERWWREGIRVELGEDLWWQTCCVWNR